jgi:hypothetical protein
MSAMQLEAPDLIFPGNFCCNCGDTNCVTEIQDTRVTRYFGLGGSETTFHLGIPVCAGCRKSTRRRPSGWFSRLLVWALTSCVLFGVLLVIGENATLPQWLSAHLFAWAAGIALLLVVGFYRLRRPTPPRTSYYQPVRIKQASVQFGEGYGRVVFMKLAFTNPEYLHLFSNANREAIQSRRIVVVEA